MEPGQTTEVFAYYGNTAAPQSERAPDVWSNGYVGVWHLEENPGSMTLDSSPSGKDGVACRLACEIARGEDEIGMNLGKIFSQAPHGRITAERVRSVHDRLWLQAAFGASRFTSA